MKKKIDMILMEITFLYLPILISGFVLSSAYFFYILLDDELAEIPFFIAITLSLLLLSMCFVNAFVISFIVWIKKKVQERKLKNKEKTQ